MSALVTGAEVRRFTEAEKLKNVSIGADPELFLMNVHGKFISSIGKIGGTKARPRPIADGCMVQEDNVAVEFNIPPAREVNGFIASMTSALEYLTKHAADQGLLLSITASKVFDADQLEHPRALAFGCETDLNAWTMKPNPGPKAENPQLRTAGGHVHIGGVEELDAFQLARWCDLTMGVRSVLEDPDKQRRELYGCAGSFRKKPYGIEYRVLSNYWIASKDAMEMVYNRAIDAVDRVMTNWIISDQEGGDIIKCINNSDKDLAEQLIAQYALD